MIINGMTYPIYSWTEILVIGGLIPIFCLAIFIYYFIRIDQFLRRSINHPAFQAFHRPFSSYIIRQLSCSTLIGNNVHHKCILKRIFNFQIISCQNDFVRRLCPL